DAEVLSIAPCPPIKRGTGRVVTGTFQHSSAKILYLYIEGQAEPLGTTANHRFWSQDHHTFVPAGVLQPGERLRGVAGDRRISAVASVPGTHQVFNLEVAGKHVYHVTDVGILVHNSN